MTLDSICRFSLPTADLDFFSRVDARQIGHNCCQHSHCYFRRQFLFLLSNPILPRCRSNCFLAGRNSLYCTLVCQLISLYYTKGREGHATFFLYFLFSVNLIYSTVLNIFHVHFISYFMWKNSHNPWWEKQSTCQILFDISKEMEFQPCKWRVDVVRIVNQTIDAFSWVRFARTADAGCVPSF